MWFIMIWTFTILGCFNVFQKIRYPFWAALSFLKLVQKFLKNFVFVKKFWFGLNILLDLLFKPFIVPKMYLFILEWQICIINFHYVIHHPINTPNSFQKNYVQFHLIDPKPHLLIYQCAHQINYIHINFFAGLTKV